MSVFIPGKKYGEDADQQLSFPVQCSFWGLTDSSQRFGKTDFAVLGTAVSTICTMHIVHKSTICQLHVLKKKKNCWNKYRCVFVVSRKWVMYLHSLQKPLASSFSAETGLGNKPYTPRVSTPSYRQCSLEHTPSHLTGTSQTKITKRFINNI